jgi:hypothetical protein
LAHHDETFTISEFGVFYPATLSFNLNPHFKTEGPAQPINRCRRIIVINCAGNPGQSEGGGFIS